MPETWSRDLTRAEWMRLFDLYYEYDRNGLRAKTPVAVKDDAYGGERFALSVPVKELAALFPMEERLANDSRSCAVGSRGSGRRAALPAASRREGDGGRGAA